MVKSNNPEIISQTVENYNLENIFDEISYDVFWFHAHNPTTWKKLIFQDYIDEIKSCKKIILENIFEAPYYSAWDSIAYELIKYHGFSKKDILVVDGGAHDEKIVPFLNYQHVTVISPETLKTTLFNIPHRHIEEKEKTKTFVSLARLPKLYRILFTQELLRKRLNNSRTIISCGSAQESVYRNLFEVVDDEFRKIFPLTPFGEIPLASEPFDIRDYNKISKALINVGIENTFENEVVFVRGKPYKINESWNRCFITEKTSKIFLHKQVPVCLAVKGHVKYLRSLGFDMFDDFVNHDYDDIESPFFRIKAVANEVERLHNKMLESGHLDFRNCIENFEERTNKNYIHMLEVKYNSAKMFHKTLKTFLLEPST